MDNPQQCVGNGQMIGLPSACHLPVSRRIKDRIFCGQTSSSVGSGRAWAGERSQGRDRKALMNLFLFSRDLSLLLLSVKKLFLSFQLLNLPHKVTCAVFLLPWHGVPGYTSVSSSPWCLTVLSDLIKPSVLTVGDLSTLPLTEFESRPQCSLSCCVQQCLMLPGCSG